MTSRDFCFWLQGYFEITGQCNHPMPVAQVEMIKNHLALVFKHEIDPSMPDPTGELQLIHDGNLPTKIGGTGPSGEIYRC